MRNLVVIIALLSAAILVSGRKVEDIDAKDKLDNVYSKYVE